MSVWLNRTADDGEVGGQLRALLKAGYLGIESPKVVVHDLQKMEQRLLHLESSFPGSSLHTVAVKANPCLGILKEIVDSGFGLEVASEGELELARAAGCAAEKIVFDSPAKTRPELEMALSLGVLINVNSAAELARIQSLGFHQRVGIRCNPLVIDDSRQAATMVATRGSKFGIPITEVGELLSSYPQVSGLHLHVGSQLAQLDDLLIAAERVVLLAREYPQIKWLDIGGGLPSRYRAEDKGLCPQEYFQALCQRVPDISNYQLITEMGRAIQAGCGWVASRVESVERNKVILHVGADLLLRECYQSETWFHEMSVFDSQGFPKNTSEQPYDIFGPLCFSGDRLALQRELPSLEPNDILVIHDCGAYTMSMWSRYCSRRFPPVVGIDREGLRLLRREESSKDIVDFWRG